MNQIKIAPSAKTNDEQDAVCLNGVQEAAATTEDVEQQSDSIERSFEPWGNLLDEVKGQFQTLGRANIKTYYKVGKLLNEEHQRIELTQQICRNHRKDFWEELANRTGVGERTLKDCYRFSQVINESQLQRLLECNAKWTKIRVLFSVRSELMDSRVDQLVNDDPDESELRRQIREEKAENAAQRKARSPKPPNTLKEGLDRGLKASEKFVGTQSAIFGSEFNLIEEMLTQPPDEVTEETKTQAQKLAALLCQIKSEAGAILLDLQPAIDRCDKVLRRRAERDKQTDADTPITT